MPIATLDDVRRASLEHVVPIVDVREHRRFTGKTEPIDTIAGGARA